MNFEKSLYMIYFYVQLFTALTNGVARNLAWRLQIYNLHTHLIIHLYQEPSKFFLRTHLNLALTRVKLAICIPTPPPATLLV